MFPSVLSPTLWEPIWDVSGHLDVWQDWGRARASAAIPPPRGSGHGWVPAVYCRRQSMPIIRRHVATADPLAAAGEDQ